jgi:1,4-alpha-glucan branching enzyme
MMNFDEVGASCQKIAPGKWQINFGIYLPGITYNDGYRLKLRVIHEKDQFFHGIEPRDYWMNWQNGSNPDLWSTNILLSPDANSNFGAPGKYLYRYQLLLGDHEVAFWFSDPFGRDVGVGTLSAFTIDENAQPFPWNDADFRVPEVDDMVVYELNVREFNADFSGVVSQLDYLWSLGVNVIELMPVTNVKESVEWGYTPLSYFAPDDRLGGPLGMKQLVNACHEHNIAVIVDAVYAHAHREFPYNLVYAATNKQNPMMGNFCGEFFDYPGTDFRIEFTREFFLEVNRYWLAEYHVDGFRYDYVPGIYDGPVGQGYADLVFRTYQLSKGIHRFQAQSRSKIIQCAEHLPDARGIISQTYSNCCWQNGLLDLGQNMAKSDSISEALAHQLDPELIGYVSEYRNDSAGDFIPVAPFQYLESHDHGRFINQFGSSGIRDLLGEYYGNRDFYYKLQPFVIALYTGKGIAMLWQGQEFGENWALPGWGLGRNLFERPLHWEYFYDVSGKALVRLHRILGGLRRRFRALRSRGYFYYYNLGEHLSQGIIAFRREAVADGIKPEEKIIVFINFADWDVNIWLPFPDAGNWIEQIDGALPSIHVAQPNEWKPVRVPSNYGAIYFLQ